MDTNALRNTSSHVLPEELKKAQAAIALPEVQEMLRKLPKCSLGIGMPHFHKEQDCGFQLLPPVRRHRTLRPRKHVRTPNLLVLLVATTILMFISCSTDSSIVGKWRQVEGTDSCEFFSDGTVQTFGSIGTRQILHTGKYSFLDGSRIKLELGGAPSIFKVAIAGDDMTLTGEKYGGTRRFKRAE